MKDNIEMILRKDLEESLSLKRFNHTMNVYRSAKKLAERYLVDEFKCMIAALGHDFTKEWSREQNASIMEKYFKNEEVFEIYPAWHGYSASIVLKQIYAIEDEDILNAIKYHTLGHKGMNDVAKIVYIADFIEPTRKKNNVEYFWSLVDSVSLDELLYEIMTYNNQYLEENNKKIPNQTMDLYAELKQILNK